MIGNDVAMKFSLPYLRINRDRKGRQRYYVRRPGAKAVRVDAKPGTPEFHAAYHAAMSAPKQRRETAGRGTWRWLCQLYFGSPEYNALASATRSQKRNVLDAISREPFAPGRDDTFGDCPLEHFTAKAVRVLRDRKRNHPEAANHRIKAISAVFRWAIEADYVASNPARDVRALPTHSDGHHPWTVEEVEQYRRCHPVSTKARLALELFLFTGARISDVARLGRPNVGNGWLRWIVAKTREPIEIPILPELQAVIDATPLTGVQTYLVTQYGRAFSIKGLGQWFRKRCDEAGLLHCSAHGLRSAGATIAAENGATPHQLQAIYGWETMRQVERYTRKARRRRLAGEAMHLLVSK